MSEFIILKENQKVGSIELLYEIVHQLKRIGDLLEEEKKNDKKW